MEEEDLIEFENVCFRYTKEQEYVLKNISFTIDAGELVGIVGNNGAGKTTLVKHLNGLLKPKKGIVKINEEDISHKPISKMATLVGLAFQNPNHQLFADSVYKELEFGPKNLGLPEEERKRIINEIVEQFQIDHLLSRSPIELSGGERRIVAIASVLTMNQKILVLDEPTYGQDYRQKQRLGEYFQELSKKGVTVIVVSHDVDFIIDFIPRVLVLADGEIIADGKTPEVFSQKEILNQAALTHPILMDLCIKIQEIFPDFPIKVSEKEILQQILQFSHSEKSLTKAKGEMK
ncbi:MAG: ATP-binding cassette domain-containing protein [Candidatus Heimdallarchaeota archaeon]|nr:ATP-binding cassette domain-containing protein [Candidatus Heimdallarchaeota archaeon]